MSLDNDRSGESGRACAAESALRSRGRLRPGRRALLPLATALVATMARAQPARRLPVVAYAGFASEAGDHLTLLAFRDGMRALGLVDRQHYVLENRHAGGDIDRAAAIIRELIALPADVIVVPGPAAARAVRRATAIPLVAVGLPPVESDPELFASLARPGGSVTGFASYGEEMSAKRLEFLLETIPGLAAIGVMHNASDPTFDAWGAQTAAVVRARGLRAVPLPIRLPDPAALAAQLQALPAAGAPALIVVRDFLTSTLAPEINRLALAQGTAVVAEQAFFARTGALFSYGASLPDLFRRAAGYVVRILRGDKPGDLPVQLPTTFEFVVNLGTARRLGLSVPPAIVARADEVIE